MSMQFVIKSLISSIALVFTAFVLTGCHTVEGAGRDVQAIGGATAETAEETRGYDREGRLRD